MFFENTCLYVKYMDMSKFNLRFVKNSFKRNVFVRERTHAYNIETAIIFCVKNSKKMLRFVF